MNTATRIEVWHDATSNPDAGEWCVSLCDSDGGEIECLAVYEHREDAVELAKYEADDLGLPACERGRDGQLEPLTTKQVCSKCGGERDLSEHGRRWNLTVEDAGEPGGQTFCGDCHEWEPA